MTTRTVIAGRYELVQPIGRGGMGEVWVGYDQRLDRRVAVKLLRRSALPVGSDPDVLARRFLREARVTARLEHPGVPAVHDAGRHERDLFLVMQYVDGNGLGDLLAERGPLPVRWAAAVAAQVCSVLAAAHAASLVHRDLKPSNLMVCPGGLVKVLDFGVAAILDPLEEARLTASGEMMGTPAYMAPEQALGGQVGPPADLYALGCVLYEMVAGRQVFQAPTPLVLMKRHVEEPPVPLREIRPEAPEALERLVLDLLAKDPQRRPADAVEVHARLLPLVVGSAVQADVPADELDPTRIFTLPPGVESPRRTIRRVVPRLADPAVRSQALRPATAGSAPVTAGPGTAAAAAPAHPDLRGLRARVAELVDRGSSAQAADLLEAALRDLTAQVGADHPAVLDLRLDFANVVFIGGDYRRALPEYEALADELARRHGADDADVLHCRSQAAACLVELGETARALRRLERLLADYRRILGPDAPETLDLRYKIGLLKAAAGDVTEARRFLVALSADQRRILGPGHPDLHAVRDLLVHLDKVSPPGR